MTVKKIYLFFELLKTGVPKLCYRSVFCKFFAAPYWLELERLPQRLAFASHWLDDLPLSQLISNISKFFAAMLETYQLQTKHILHLRMFAPLAIG
jgi:hypothetical protein